MILIQHFGLQVELFGMQRDTTALSLEPLADSFRPAMRIATPWCIDDLLKLDANVISTADQVLVRIAAGRARVSGMEHHHCKGHREECEQDARLHANEQLEICWQPSCNDECVLL